MTLIQEGRLDADDARRLTERIRLIAGNVADNVEKLRDLVEQARVGEAGDRNGNDVRLARRPDPVFPIWTTKEAK